MYCETVSAGGVARESAVLEDDEFIEEGEKQFDEDDDAAEGIGFTVPEGFAKRQCLILRQALYKMSDATDPRASSLTYIFRRNEHRIHQIARRLMVSTPANATIVITSAAVSRN